ncbi:hypothetical protein [Sphingomonas elodea]|uniref:hypothetical protein n=1 Tax=Sphingomonas elodea TaxID=179878 RepID=UPI001110D0E0|nr:hypothetical protein [Sphingomonas elodea]
MDIDSRNAAIVIIGQCLLGVINRNFKRISVYLSEEEWNLKFDLERDNIGDLEIIEDAMGELDGLALDLKSPPSKIKYSIDITGSNLLKKQNDDWIVIFLMRQDV